MTNEIKEAIALLRKNDYIVRKITKDMAEDSNECEKMSDTGDYKDCGGCSCNVCIMQ